MEFLRFGSSIPGSYWGCCACCIIQNFKVDPDEKASIQIVSGDGGGPVGSGTGKFAGPTWRDIFWQRLRYGTFNGNDMPNHAFLAILTEWQIQGAIGKKWLEILREAGFEFIRTVNNSVYSGPTLSGAPKAEANSNDNHIFGLFRNIGSNSLKDPFTPPKAWADLPVKKTDVLQCVLNNEFGIEGMTFDDLAKTHFAEDKAIWDAMPAKKFFTEAELEAQGVPIWYAGTRSPLDGSGGWTFKQQKKEDRRSAEANFKSLQEKGGKVNADPFGKQSEPIAKM